MTIHELSQLYYLKREIERDTEKLEHLRSERVPGSPNMDGMPHASGFDSSKTERLVAEIIDLEAIIAAKQIQCIHERQRLERFIVTVPDSLTRLILECRFMDCMTWDDVASEVGGGNTAESVRQRCSRYVRSTQDDAEGANGHENGEAELEAV